MKANIRHSKQFSQLITLLNVCPTLTNIQQTYESPH